MSIARDLALALAIAAVSLGCTTITNLGSHDGAASSLACGPTSCAEGLVCCNASCGICTLPGTACIDIPCTDGGGSTCGADDAVLQGSCSSTTTLYTWTGTDCVALTGCECAGRDCDRLRATRGQCFEEHFECWNHACTTGDPLACREGYFCEVATCAETAGTCVRSPESCPSHPVEPVVCGCDGEGYANACDARQHAISHDDSETCTLCEPRLPTVSGVCSDVLGVAWDGGQCAPVRGCSCTGDCDRLYASLADCTFARDRCLTFACDTMRCARWDEICVMASSGTRCDPLPGACEGVPSCDCISPLGTCIETGRGAYSVTP